MAKRNTYYVPADIQASNLNSFVGTPEFDAQAADQIVSLLDLVQRLSDRIDILEQALTKSTAADVLNLKEPSSYQY